MSIPTSTEPTPSRDRWFLGTRLRVVADATATGGALTVMEQWAPGGFSPPLHRHGREDTALFVLEGTLTVRTGATERPVGPGGFAWLPRDVPHSFRVEGHGAHFLEFATPAGIEAFHLATSDPADGPGLPAPSRPDLPALAAEFARCGGEILGPPMP